MIRMTHRQKAAMLQVFLADRRGETCKIRKVTADALISEGLLEHLPVSGSHRLTDTGNEWMKQYSFEG